MGPVRTAAVAHSYQKQNGMNTMAPERKRFRLEAERLAGLSVRDRKAALDVHRRIAGDARLSQPTRDHARTVADTLESLIAQILTRRKKP